MLVENSISPITQTITEITVVSTSHRRHSTFAAAYRYQKYPHKHSRHEISEIFLIQHSWPAALPRQPNRTNSSLFASRKSTALLPASDRHFKYLNKGSQGRLFGGMHRTMPNILNCLFIAVCLFSVLPARNCVSHIVLRNLIARNPRRSFVNFVSKLCQNSVTMKQGFREGRHHKSDQLRAPGNVGCSPVSIHHQKLALNLRRHVFNLVCYIRTICRLISSWLRSGDDARVFFASSI